MDTHTDGDGDIMTTLQNWTLDTIYNETRTLLEQNGLTKAVADDLITRLEFYRIVRNPSELVKGSTLYYFQPQPPGSKTSIIVNSGIFCNINKKATKDCGLWITCRNYGFPMRFYQICFAQHLIFQRFTRDQQMLIESAELLL